MFVYLKSLMIVVIEVFCCKLFFEIFVHQRQYRYKVINVILFLLLIIMNFSVVKVSGNFAFKQIAVILLVGIFMFGLFEITVKRVIILSIIYQGLLLVVDYVDLVLLNIFIRDEIISSSMPFSKSEMFILLGKAFLFICVVIIGKYCGNRPKSKVGLFNNDGIRLLSFPIMTICSITALIIWFIDYSNKTQLNTLFVIACSLVFMNIIEFYLIKGIFNLEKQIRENESFKLQVAKQTEMYHSISKNLDNQRKKAHEYKNQITCIESLLMNKEYEQAKNYVREVNGTLEEYFSLFDTKNVIVNAILNSKYLEGREKNILFVFKLGDLSELKIRDTDVVVLLSNLVNNAIEATEQGDGKRIIKVKFLIEADEVILAVANSHENDLELSGNSYRTTKLVNPSEHGIGLKNIIDTVKKYNGNYTIRDKSGEFLFSAILPNK